MSRSAPPKGAPDEHPACRRGTGPLLRLGIHLGGGRAGGGAAAAGGRTRLHPHPHRRAAGNGRRGDSAAPGVIDAAPRRPVDERIGRGGLAVAYVGIALLLACIVLRGLATLRAPWGNMYEF